MKSRRLTLPLSIACFTASLMWCANLASAQDAYLEHTIDSSFANAAALESLSGQNSMGHLTPPSWASAENKARLYYLQGRTELDKDGKSVAAPVPFWKEGIVSLSYEFERDSTVFGRRTDIHSVTPRLYLESTGGLSLQLDYSYANASTDLSADRSEDIDEHSVSIKAGQDLFRLFSLRRPDTLTLSLQLIYSNEDGSIDLRRPFGSRDFSDDIYHLRPELIYCLPLNHRVAVTLDAMYDFRWIDRRETGANSSYNDGFFTLLGRVDVRLCQRSTAYVEAAYDHFDARSGGTDSDYADFGAGLRFDVGPATSLKVGYDYTAFLPNGHDNTVFVRAEYHF